MKLRKRSGVKDGVGAVSTRVRVPRDLAVFGVLFAISSGVSLSMPGGGSFGILLFPICLFVLTTRRAALLFCSNLVFGCVVNVFQYGTVVLWAYALYSGGVAPFMLLGAWLFKRFRKDLRLATFLATAFPFTSGAMLIFAVLFIVVLPQFLGEAYWVFADPLFAVVFSTAAAAVFMVLGSTLAWGQWVVLEKIAKTLPWTAPRRFSAVKTAHGSKEPG